MVDVDERNTERTCHTFGKRHTDEQTAHEPRTTCEGDGRELFTFHTCTLECLIHHWHDVLFMSPRSQFGDNAAVGLMYGLRGSHVRQQNAITKDGHRRVITR